MKKGIVIAFPGIRYTCRQQLMQDCLAFYTARGYETLCLDFAGVPFDGTADMGRAAELALPSILGRLSGVRFADYTDVAFLAKSLGTFGAVVGTKDAHLAADQLEQFCKARAIPCLIVPDAGHRLQFEDADKTQAVNRSITAMLR